MELNEYKIPKDVVANALAFLDRCELKGVEAEALVTVKYYLKNPVKAEDENK